MPTLEEKYPQYRGNIEAARRSGHSDGDIESFLTTRLGAKPATPKQQELSFAEALQQNLDLPETPFEAVSAGLQLLSNPVGFLLSDLGSSINDVPQDLLTAVLSPDEGQGVLSTFARGKDPSEALGIENPIGKFVADVTLDPVNLLGGAGVARQVGKLGRARNVVGEALESGAARIADEAADGFSSITKDINGQPRFDEFDEPANNIMRAAANSDEELQAALREGRVTHDELFLNGQNAAPSVLDDVLSGAYNPETATIGQQIGLKINAAENIEKIFDDVVSGASNKLVQAIRQGKAFSGRRLAAEKVNIPLPKKTVDDIRAKFNAMPEGPEKELLSEVLDSVGITKKVINPGKLEKFVEWSTMIKLTGLSSHIRGAIGNASMLFLRPAEKVAAGLTSSARKAFLGVDKSVFAREAAAESMAMFKGLPEGFSKSWQFFKDPDAYFAEATKAGEVLLQGGAIGKGGRVGEALEALGNRAGIGGLDVGGAVRLPGRLIGAMDVFFKHINFNAEVAAQATRIALKEGLARDDLVKRVAALLEDPKIVDPVAKKIKQQADFSAKERVFQGDLTGIAKTLNGLRKKHPLARIVVPFFNTPVNLIKQSAQRSPATLALPSTWKTIKRGTEAEKVELIGRALSGSLFLGATGIAAYSGRLSGRGSKSRSRNDLRRLSGWQPNSIYANGTWISYQGFEPITSWFRTIGDAVNKAEEGATLGQISGQLPLSYVKQFAENPFLMGINDLFEGLNDPEAKASTVLAGLVTGSTIPVILQQWGKTVYDPVIREPKTFTEKVASRVPFGGSITVAPKRNIYGEEVVRDARGIPTAFGFTMSFDKGSPLDLELIRLSRGPEGITISKPSNKVYGFELNRDEHDRLIVLRGTLLKESLQRLVEHENYAKLNDTARRRAVSRIVRRINDLARNQVFAKYVSGRL